MLAGFERRRASHEPKPQKERDRQLEPVVRVKLKLWQQIGEGDAEERARREGEGR